LSIILGDVGTGKTTLARALLGNFAKEKDFIFHIFLDPECKSEYQFLLHMVKMFGIKPSFNSTLDFKEEIERHLFHKGVDENKTIVLLIDEGQKLSQSSLEVLRVLLNYETNEYKLLQLVIFAQTELLPKIKDLNNFYDRISLKYTINPLDLKETKELIQFRLKQAGYKAKRALFMDEAIKMIYDHSQGYPRKIAVTCHNALEVAVMNDLKLITEDVIDEVTKSEGVSIG
jgi:general secretion pathway protein A